MRSKFEDDEGREIYVESKSSIISTNPNRENPTNIRVEGSTGGEDEEESSATNQIKDDSEKEKHRAMYGSFVVVAYVLILSLVC